MEEYTSYDLALDNRDALASDAYKNAENYYKSVFENAGGSINFYPDKSGAAPTAEMYHRETSEFSVQDVKAFCKKHGITENVFFISAFGITLGKSISGRMRYLPLFTTAETIPDFPIPWVCW